LPKLDEATTRRLELFRVLVEEAREYAIFLLDRDGRVSSWNAGAERIKGYRADEVLGRSFSMFYQAEDVARHLPETILARAAAEGRVESEGWRVRKDGSTFWAAIVVTAVRDAEGELVGFSKLVRDMSEEHRARDAQWELRQEQAARAAAEAVSEKLRRSEE